MGVISKYAQARVSEVVSETKDFVQRPIAYAMEKQVIRKAVLLEWLDCIRPVVGTRWEHRIETST